MQIWKWLAGGVLLVVAVVGWTLLPLENWAASFQSWIEGLGLVGGLAFAGVYIVATVLLLPVSVLTVAAGFAFGLAFGFALVVPSATIGATLAFVVSRYVVRRRVKALVERHARFKAVNQAVSDSGWQVVALLRLSPLVPFNLQNYLYGITDIKLVHYVPATFLGIMPGTLLYVYLGAAGNAASAGGRGPLELGFFVAGLVATIAVVVLVTRKARQILERQGVGASATR